jgi:poly-beta-1,6-N-acetyl-D-glucosamine N-deacetylase
MLREMLNKNLIFRSIKFSGLPFIFRNTFQRKQATIILYHDIRSKLFEKHYLYLRKFYNIISLQDYIEYRTLRNTKLPQKSLIITLDDGHKENYRLLPIIKKYQIPLTIFLCAEIINTNRHYWFEHALQNNLDLVALKKVPDAKRLELLSESGFEEEKEFDTRQALNFAEIEEMSTFVDFQAHTNFHPILPNCDEEKSKKEIIASKTKLQNLLKTEINSIAFPNGDFTEREVAIAKDCGYKVGTTVEEGFNNDKTDLLKLNRFSLLDNSCLDECIAKTSGCWYFFKKILGKSILKFSKNYKS